MAIPNTTPRDPRLKNEIKKGLEELLYEPVKHRMNKVLNTIIIRNAVVNGYAHMSFTHKGVFYTCEQDIRNKPPLRRNQLHQEFHPAMEEYLEELRQLEEEEKPYVLGFITKVLNACDDLSDCLKIFPESMHRPIKIVLSNWFHAGNNLSDEAIKGFLEAEQEAIMRLKRRMATNLLY